LSGARKSAGLLDQKTKSRGGLIEIPPVDAPYALGRMDEIQVVGY
jgi:hypothetical protein